LGSQAWLIQREALPPYSGVDHVAVVDVEVEGVVRILRVVRVAAQRLLPG
jgi:hypothetical protein